MSLLAIVLAVTIAGPDTEQQSKPIVRVTAGPYFDTTDPVEMERRLRRSFDLMDFNEDGYLSGEEIPMASRGRVAASGRITHESASTSYWLENNDANGDRRVEWHEMRDHMMPSLLFKITNPE